MVSPLPEVPHMGDLNMKNAQTDALARANYLPDSATKIFYPGWDVTFSGGVNAQGVDQGTFYATFGLGSPFVEDSKLCAAVNGMWVGTSPDAARTYRASLTSVQTGVFKSEKPPTALPLLDNELGYNALSPAVADYGLKETTGWDGEQGPCLKAGAGTVIVNFTDIARADYVQNALKGEFDMSQLRKITTAEMKFRMSCLSRSYKALGLPTTALWMVGAEKVADWAQGANGYCIPKNLVAGGNGWITQSKLAKGGEGYLYVFAKMDESIVNPMPNSKRALQKCTDVYAFQLTADELKYCKLSASNSWAPQWM
jgi:hypothetical protein